MEKASFLVAIVAVLSMVLVSVESAPQSNYLIPTFKANWHKAVEHCYSIGMKLAEIDNQDKETKLKQEILASSIYKEGNTVVWIGANDQAEEGKFYWHDSGIQVTFSNWASNEPNNHKKSEHCVEYGIVTNGNFLREWKWNDFYCSYSHYFACESA